MESPQNCKDDIEQLLCQRVGSNRFAVANLLPNKKLWLPAKVLAGIASTKILEIRIQIFGYFHIGA